MAHSNRQDHNDKHAMCNDKEGRLYFMLFNLLMNMLQLLREEMIHYNKEFMDAFDINRHDVNLQVRIPINVNGMKALITDGKNSILKNFPVQQVFEINSHECVSLVETVRLMSGNGAE